MEVGGHGQVGESAGSRAAGVLRGLRRDRDEASFADVVSGKEKDPIRVARAAAREFVSDALVKPVLSKLRETTWAAEPFEPGAHEKMFAPMFDEMIASELVSDGDWAVVDRVAEQIIKKSGEARAARERTWSPAAGGARSWEA